MTVIVDESLAPTVAVASLTDRRFFVVDDGGCNYWVVAHDVAHAKLILRASGVEFTADNGETATLDDPRFAALEWKEITSERAAEINTHGERGDVLPLSQRDLGDWFASEW